MADPQRPLPSPREHLTPPTPKPQDGPATITMKSALPNHEQTRLTPLQEVLFQQWARANNIEDVNDPQAHYDYRGYYLATNGAMHPPGTQEHFPDTFKQHGHPTFSTQSIYSKGPADGGAWIGKDQDLYLPQNPMLPSHDVTIGSPLEHALLGRQPMMPSHDQGIE